MYCMYVCISSGGERLKGGMLRGSLAGYQDGNWRRIEEFRGIYVLLSRAITYCTDVAREIQGDSKKYISSLSYLR